MGIALQKDCTGFHGEGGRDVARGGLALSDFAIGGVARRVR
jgi:hypothetical protein